MQHTKRSAPAGPDRVPEMKWLAECSVAALREALEAVAPELSGYPVTVPGPAGKEDPLWHSGCVPVGDQFFVKFAWSRPAALQLAREIAVLAALTREPAVPFLPEVVASSTDPLHLITRRCRRRPQPPGVTAGYRCVQHPAAHLATHMFPWKRWSNGTADPFTSSRSACARGRRRPA